MIRKVRGEFVAECNDCGDDYAGGTNDDFRDFVEELKSEDWTIRNEDGEWCHYCPSCKPPWR